MPINGQDVEENKEEEEDDCDDGDEGRSVCISPLEI